MNVKSLKVEHLFELIKEMENIAQTEPSNFAKTLQFHLHNTCKGSWNEIWFMAENPGTKKKRLLAKVSISGLSDEERQQLEQLVWHYNPKQLSIRYLLTEGPVLAKSALTELWTFLTRPLGVSYVLRTP